MHIRNRLSPVESLITLPRLQDAEERRASWRQAITALGGTMRVLGPSPLDDVDPQQLQRCVLVALEAGLCDSLDFIAAGEAAVALYEIMNALPHGRERRELGRRVFTRLYEGRAQTFAAVATRMALGSGRALDASTMRARVSLLFDLPIGVGLNADPLALTLVSRRDLLERWVTGPSTGALPARRMAAKLLEHAAREAVTRSEQGDPYPRKVMTSDPVRVVFERLLADREPLVWRHAAVARGLLATVEPRIQSEIENSLDPALSPTAWRRAAVSVVALLAADPGDGMNQCRGLLESRVMQKDPGIAATMVWGLPRVIEAEPDAAEAVLERLSALGRHDVAEAMAELLSDLANTGFGAAAVSTLEGLLRSRSELENHALCAMAEQSLRQIELLQADDGSVHAALRRALLAYESTGARSAYEHALVAVQNAQREVIQLAALDPEDEPALPEMLFLLADLDSSALERARLSNLLLLGRRPGDTDASVPEMERLYDSIGTWALDAEEVASDTQEWTPIRTLSKQRRLRALLHLVDLETVSHAEGDAGAARVRTRARRVLQVLLGELASGPDGSIHRILSATVARSIDAAVREGFAEPSDVLLAVAAFLEDQESIAAIAEASTNPEVQAPMAAFNTFLEGSSLELLDEDSVGPTGVMRPLVSEEAAPEIMTKTRAVVKLSHSLAGGSYRGESLRSVLLVLGRSLEAIAAAHSLRDLVDGAQTGADPIGELEASCDALRQLVLGARRRVLGFDGGDVPVVADVASISSLVERAATGIPADNVQLAAAITELVAELPSALAGAVALVANRLATLPVSATSDVYAIPLEKRRPALPDWLLPRRTIGAFYVVRALGSGGVSSVFVARRFEERHDRAAEAFALKVPVYDPSTARRLSEQEFMQLFREEAGALLSLPHHPHLARFVTFDLAARPRPILVMELIRGVGLDRLIRSRSLNMPRVVRHLDGVLAGLEAMHRVGVGHLDVKPSNVILREDGTPVLVDFGLSGRQVRPGCGTLEYTAPEVLGVVPPGHTPQPQAADLYSFACAAFEVLTAELLFDAVDETALMSQHISHDGWPARLTALASIPSLGELCVVLAACLRRDPRDRPDASSTRAALAHLAPRLSELDWPLAPAGVMKAS